MNNDQLTLKELVKEQFNIDLPVSGGFGNTFEDAIVLEAANRNEAMNFQYLIIDCIRALRGTSFLGNGNEEHFLDGKYYSLIKTITAYGDEEIFYFDITSYRSVDMSSIFSAAS